MFFVKFSKLTYFTVLKAIWLIKYKEFEIKQNVMKWNAFFSKYVTEMEKNELKPVYMAHLKFNKWKERKTTDNSEKLIYNWLVLWIYLL